MIKLERVSVAGFEPAVRGMRNPKNSWDKSDSHPGMSGDEWSIDPGFIIGEADKKLMVQLAKGGSVHAKYRRQIVVWVDITAPLYFWKEFDTYKVGTVSNSCSTMHKIHEKKFTLDDFSHEHLMGDDLTGVNANAIIDMTCKTLNQCREMFLATNDKCWWWQMIQLLPSSYNQKRTVMLSYEVLTSIYRDRKNHKLDEWQAFCKWAESLPYSWCFTLKGIENAQKTSGNEFIIIVDTGFVPYIDGKPVKIDLYLAEKKIGTLIDSLDIVGKGTTELRFELIPEIYNLGLQREWNKGCFSYGYTLNEDEDIIQMRLYRKENDFDGAELLV